MKILNERLWKSNKSFKVQCPLVNQLNEVHLRLVSQLSVTRLSEILVLNLEVGLQTPTAISQSCAHTIPDHQQVLLVQ
jgi:hypothetical protein